MIIRYDDKGRVLSCTVDSWAADGHAGDRVLRVADDELPEDFLATFALGKYVVRRQKVVENKDFAPPDARRFRKPPRSRKAILELLKQGAGDSE
jgi:hypothetical protein